MNEAVEIGEAKVLIVDDSTVNLDLLRNMLQPVGYQIFFATSGEMALEVAAGSQPDVILLDAMMPGIDGFETCRRLKASEKMRDIPVIFVTAKTETKDLALGFEVGGVDYITKPVKQPEVLARVRTHLQIRALIRQQQQHLEALELAQRDLQELNATKDKFMSSIAGDLQSSLKEISVASRTLTESAASCSLGEDDVERQLQGVNSSAESVLQLLENILEWPRVQLGQKLDLFRMDVTDKDLGHLTSGLDNLRFLSLADTNVTNEGLVHLKDLKELQELHLDATQVNDDGLPLLTCLENLEVLDLKETQVTDAGLARLQPLKKLRGLYLTRTGIGDEGLSHLSGFSDMQILILWQTKVTDKGLAHLESLKNLQELILWNTDVTEEGVERLARALPECDISLDMYA
jgi:DNA-binding response OmpR family regulator